jgi:hypothetical protein
LRLIVHAVTAPKRLLGKGVAMGRAVLARAFAAYAFSKPAR